MPYRGQNASYHRGRMNIAAGGENLASGPRKQAKVAGPTVGAGYAKALFDLAVAKGADPALLLARAGMQAADFADADNRIPLANHIALMRAGQALSGDAALALHFGETYLGEYSVVGLIADASKTMGHALVQLNRYGRLVIEVDVGEGAERFRVERADGEAWFIDTRRDPNSFPELTESTFARMASHTRQFGTDDKPWVRGVHVTHAEPTYRAEYDRIFRVPTVFNAECNALLIDDDWTTRKVARSTRYAFGVLSEHAKALLEKLEAAKTTRGQVESLLIPILHTGEPNVERIAEKMGQSRKTLYRKLKAEGTTFAKLLDELRHKMALHYLDGKKVSVNETAYLVGFSDPSTFSRAFKRWTGASPRKLRV
jgi:AraC-like DNA-binding protein